MLMIGISRRVLKLLMNVEIDENQRVFGKVDLDDLVKDATEGNNEEVDQELQIFQNALDLSNTKARECKAVPMPYRAPTRHHRNDAAYSRHPGPA